MLTSNILLILKRYMPIYTIAGVFITIKEILIHTVNTSTKTSVIYSYEVLVAIRASLAL
jgi:hypothetical protein